MVEKPFQWPGRRVGDPAHEMLVGFLVMDIQRNPEWANELAARIMEVKSGRLAGWERIGNAYRLELTGKNAFLEDLVDEDIRVQRISLKEFSQAVDAWIQTLDQKYGKRQHTR
jgi:hypothetical protein